MQFFVLSRWQDGGQRRGGDDWGGGSERRRKDRLQRYVPTSSMAAHFNKVTSQTSSKRTPLCVQLSLFPWVHSLYGDEIVQNMIKSITEDFFLPVLMLSRMSRSCWYNVILWVASNEKLIFYLFKVYYQNSLISGNNSVFEFTGKMKCINYQIEKISWFPREKKNLLLTLNCPMLVYRVCPTYDREVIVSTSVLHTFELCATPREKPSSSSASACTCTLYVYRSVSVRVRAIEH